MLQSTKLNGVEGLKRVLALNMAMKSLDFAQLVFGLALVQYFLTVIPSLHFGIVIYILCHSMLEVCHLLFFLFCIYRVLQLRYCMNLRRETLDFSLLSKFETVIKTMGTFEVGLTVFLHYDMATSLWRRGRGM